MADGTPSLPDTNPRAVIGDNKPPAEVAFEAMKAHMDDLLVEAHNWADGAIVENQAQADEASRLIDDLRKAAKAADDLRVEEKKPLDEAIAEIQARWGLYIADPKNKVPGKIWKAIDALKAAVKPFLEQLENERRAAAEEARQRAEAAAQAAQAAVQNAAPSDLAGREAAEDLVQAAERARAEVRQVENERPQARGGDRAMGLRRVFKPVMTDAKAALNHYATTRRDDLIGFLQKLAEEDVRRSIHTIPGFVIEEGSTL